MYLMDVRSACKKIGAGSPGLGGESPGGDRIGFSNYSMLINEKPFFSISGEFHFSRYPCEFWEEQILKIKTCGLDTIATYMFWNYHEFREGQFDFSGDRDVRRFCELCQKHGLFVILRIGPYSHGECRNGGLPDWLFGRPFEVRSNDPGYLAYVARYFHKIGKEVRNLMFTRGGPIIGIQIENEFMAACSPWEVTVTQKREWITQGTGGTDHIRRLMGIAREAGLETAFYTATGWGGSPYVQDEMLPLWGGYAYWPWLYWDTDANIEHPPTHGYLFKNQHDETIPDGFAAKYPYACCEMGGGMQTWYPYRFVVEPGSVEAMSLVTVANGCNFIGYYMFNGGCNKVIENTYMNEQLSPRISYDFQAPLSDSGRPGESYKRLKLLHYMFRDFNDALCAMPCIAPEGSEALEPSDVITLRYAARSDGKSGLLFVNNFQDHVGQRDKEGVRINVKTQDGDILIPRHKTMDIPKNVSAVFPFNCELSGILLEYSTVQYIAVIENGDENCFFFFSHPGLRGELCFKGAFEPADAFGIRHEIIGGDTFVYVPDDRTSGFSLYNPEGRKISFVCLDRKQSLDFHRISVNSADYAVITPANAYCDESTISFEAVGIDTYPVRTYPELPRFLVDGGSMIEAPAGSGLNADSHGNGILRDYVMTCNIPDIPVTVLKRYDNRALLKFDAGMLDGLSEAYVCVDYAGDIGWAFIDGELIHDNLSNGQTWIFGIGRHKEKLVAGELYIYVSPLSDAVRVESADTFARVHVSSEKKAAIGNIRIIPEKTQLVSFIRY